MYSREEIRDTLAYRGYPKFGPLGGHRYEITPGRQGIPEDLTEHRRKPSWEMCTDNSDGTNDKMVSQKKNEE